MPYIVQEYNRPTIIGLFNSIYNAIYSASEHEFIYEIPCIIYWKNIDYTFIYDNNQRVDVNSRLTLKSMDKELQDFVLNRQNDRNVENTRLLFESSLNMNKSDNNSKLTQPNT